MRGVNKMKLKRKDIISLIVCVVVIIGAGYFAFRLLGGSSKKTTTQTTDQQTQQQEVTISGNIDNDTLANIKKYKDYDEAKLDNIGRINPFAPLN